MDPLKIVIMIVSAMVTVTLFLWKMSTKARKRLRDAFIDVDQNALIMVTYALSPMAMKLQVDECLARLTNMEAAWRKDSFCLFKVKSKKYESIYEKMKRVEDLLQDCLLKDAYIRTNAGNMHIASVNNNVMKFTQILGQNSAEIRSLIQEWRNELY